MRTGEDPWLFPSCCLPYALLPGTSASGPAPSPGRLGQREQERVAGETVLKLPRLSRTRQSLPPSPSVAVRAEQGPGAGDHLPAPPAPAALLTQRCSWPWERRLETLGYPWAAAASGPGRPDWSRRSRGPSSPQPLRGSGSPWSLGTQPGHSRRVPGASCRELVAEQRRAPLLSLPAP